MDFINTTIDSFISLWERIPQVEIETEMKIMLYFTAILTIVGSALCSFSEASVMSFNKNRLRSFKKKINHEKRYNQVAKIIGRRDSYITLVIIMNTLINISGSTYLGILVSQVYESLEAGIFTFSFTMFILYGAEMIPKLVAVQNPEMVIRKIAPFLIYSKYIMKPLVLLSKLVCSKFVSKGDDESIISFSDVKSLLSDAKEDGAIKNKEYGIIKNVFKLKGKSVRDMLVCKTEIEYIDENKDILKSIDDIKALTHQKVVTTDIEGNPTGIAFKIELLESYLNTEDKKISDFRHDLLVVNESDCILEVLAKFNQTEEHIALVMCEHGGYLGVISVKDILDSITLGVK